jgi:hypothetical protein
MCMACSGIVSTIRVPISVRDVSKPGKSDILNMPFIEALFDLLDKLPHVEMALLPVVSFCSVDDDQPGVGRDIGI